MCQNARRNSCTILRIQMRIQILQTKNEGLERSIYYLVSFVMKREFKATPWKLWPKYITNYSYFGLQLSARSCAPSRLPSSNTAHFKDFKCTVTVTLPASLLLVVFEFTNTLESILYHAPYLFEELSSTFGFLMKGWCQTTRGMLLHT